MRLDPSKVLAEPLLQVRIPFLNDDTGSWGWA